MYDAGVFHEWISDSFYGQESWAQPAMGYVAPPLDGIWATAPYLHNGSVPTLDALLNSESRPDCWTWSYDSSDYDTTAVGWNWEASGCHAQIPNAAQRALVYDSTQPSYGNQGHTFGDAFSDEERAAVIAYLKTL